MMVQTFENREGRLPHSPHVPRVSLSCYRTQLSEDLLDEQGEVLDHLISFAFDTLGVRVLDVRVVAADCLQLATCK
jgi:hypothetical protein